MTEKLTKTTIIPISLCDYDGLLGVSQTFSLFMDLATEHAKSIRVGISDIGKDGLFWLAVRTRIRFLRRPEVEETVTLSTWPEKPRGMRNNRSYLVEKDGEHLVEGKTEWAILNTKTGKLVSGDEVNPKDLIFEESTALDEPFERIRDNFDEKDRFAQTEVRSTDIDLGGHMNNAAYLRALFSTLSVEERRKTNIVGIDVRFVSPSYEGDVLRVFRRNHQERTEYCMKKPDGTTVLLAAVW